MQFSVVRPWLIHRMLVDLNMKVYRTVLRPAMLYGSRNLVYWKRSRNNERDEYD